MADISLPSIYPKGTVAQSLEGIEHLIFGRNFGCSTGDVDVSPVSGIYDIVLDSRQIVSGIYFVNAETIDGNKFSAVISANGKQSAFEGNVEYKNTIQLLSVSSHISLQLIDVDLRAATTTDVGVLLSLKSNPESNQPIKVQVTLVGSVGLVNPSSNYNSYSLDIGTSVTGLHLSASVMDDKEGVGVDLDEISRNSIILCNPASLASRPNDSGIGMCSTFVGGSIQVQLFWSDDSKMFFRTSVTSWVEVSNANAYPKPVANGFFFVSSTGANETSISVGSIDLRQLRYSIILTPEYDVVNLSDSIQISERNDGSFKVKTLEPWAGVISYTIVETRASDSDPVFNLTVGRLDGQDVRPATSVEEGQHVRFVLSTLNVPDGSLIPYTLQGVNEADVGVPLSGYLSVKNSSAYVDINILKDMVADGDKSLKMLLTNGASVNASIMMQDTSTAPEFEIYFAKDKAGKQPVTQMTDGFQIYLIVRGILYDKSVEYKIDFAGSTFASSDILGSLPSSIVVKFDNNDMFTYPIAFNQPSINEQVVTISTDQTDLNLYNLAKSRLITIKDPCNIRFVINSGVTVSASSVLKPAITVGDFPYGSKIVVVNNGTIVGRGGRGGYAPSSMAQNSLDGESGGPCINGSASVFLTVENYGSIYSGGGGGGAAGVLSYLGSPAHHPILSGGGGAPFGLTPNYMPASVATIGTGNSSFLTEYADSMTRLVRYLYSENGLMYRLEANNTLTQNASPVIGDATATAGAKYITAFVPVSPGNGGDRGLGGTDGFINNIFNFQYTTTVRNGKGGKAGRIILENEYNVLIKNMSGIVRGH